MQNEIQDLIEQIKQLDKEGNFQEIVNLLPDKLLQEKNNAFLYASLGFAFGELKQYDDAIKNFTKAIELDPNSSFSYNNRGSAWFFKEHYDKAIEDITKAIELDPNSSLSYNLRGTALFLKGIYDKAIEDFTKAIELHPSYLQVYNRRGYLLVLNGEFEKAIEDFTKAIEIDANYTDVYYNRAISYTGKNELNAAIQDYEKYLSLTQDQEDYWSKKAKANINKLKQKLAYTTEYQEKLNSIKKNVEEIKKLLIFNEDYITHYTSLTSAKILILNINLEKDKTAKFRLSEGVFMNDPSEGKILYNYLDFSTSHENVGQSSTDNFTEKPFLGSFVSQTKYDDLTLWRMYGKEAMQEAKGAALTLNRKVLIDNIIKDIKEQDLTNTLSLSNEFKFYKVAYIKKNGDNYNFTIPDAGKNMSNKLKKLMRDLKQKVTQVSEEDEKIELARVLNDIMYHFKSADYYYEHEVRLIISGDGFKKIIETKDDKPKVSIELTSIVPALHKITLGPKVERAEEWAAAFHYHIKENYDNKVDIIISHLPFK